MAEDGRRCGWAALGRRYRLPQLRDEIVLKVEVRIGSGDSLMERFKSVSYTHLASENIFEKWPAGQIERGSEHEVHDIR